MPIARGTPIPVGVFPLLGYEPDGADCIAEAWDLTMGRFRLLIEVRRNGAIERYVDGERVS